jgi:ribokinase
MFSPEFSCMKKVLFVGDINVDVMMGGMQSLPVVDKEVMCASYDVVMGSSAVICAAAYASLGGNASFLGLAGNDDYGNFMIKGLNELGIATDRVRRTDKFRTGVTINMIHGSTRTQVTYPGTISEFDGRDIDAKTLQGFDHIHFAGPYQQTKLRPEITRLLKLAQAQKSTTSLDPQWDATEKWEYMEQWLPLLTYLFVNEGEALSLAKTQSLEEACTALQSKTKRAVLKAGKDGSMISYEGGIYKVPARIIQVVDTTGAGDCFDAGFLFATLEQNLTERDALEIGNAVGSRSCLFAGGVAHRSTYADIVKFISAEQP